MSMFVLRWPCGTAITSAAARGFAGGRLESRQVERLLDLSEHVGQTFSSG